MNYKEKHIIDKTAWPDGPWKHEPDSVLWDIYPGYFCKIKRVVRDHNGQQREGYLCGYVSIPSTHPYAGISLSNWDLLGPGVLKLDRSVSYSGYDSTDDKYTYGFDCASAFDKIPLDQSDTENTYPTIEYCMWQCQMLAKQLKDLESDIHCAKYIEFIKEKRRTKHD